MIIVKVPGINGLGKTSGARDAGREILKEVKGEYRNEEIHVDNSNLEEQEQLIRKNAVKLFNEEDRIVFLGGDHSISFPLVDSFREVKGDDVRLVIFDAHADCMPSMKEPTHEEWLRALIEKGFKGSNVMLIGARKIEKVENEFLNLNGVRRIGVDDIRYDSAKVLRRIREFINDKEIYVSFDVDVFDPSIVKATGYLEENGLKEDEVLRLIDVINEGNVSAMDLVEVHLKKKGIDDTLRLAGEVLEKFI